MNLAVSLSECSSQSSGRGNEDPTAPIVKANSHNHDPSEISQRGYKALLGLKFDFIL
jgi:hypothetical protein